MSRNSNLIERIKNSRAKRFFVLVVFAVFCFVTGVALDLLTELDKHFIAGFTLAVFVFMVLLADEISKVALDTNEKTDSVE